MINRNERKKHLREECTSRKVQCEYCDKTLVYRKMQVSLLSCMLSDYDERLTFLNLQEHHKVCDNFPLRCENCEEEVPRKDVRVCDTLLNELHFFVCAVGGSY